MEHEEKAKPSRFANAQELRDYVEYHRSIFLKRINGLEDLELGEDEDGSFVTLRIKEDLHDERELTIEAAAGLMSWQGQEERIMARVKVEKIDETHQ